MAERLITEKLESLRHCLARVKLKCPATVDELVSNFDIQDVLVLNLSRAVQLCVDIGAHIIANSDEATRQTMGETFSILERMNILPADIALKMRKAVVFRNIAVHGYENLNMDVVFAIATDYLGNFKAFAKAMGKASDIAL